MSRKVCIANLPAEAGEPGIKALFSSAGSVMSVKIIQDRQTAKRHCFRGDVYPVGSPESRFHAEPPGFHGEEFAG